MVLAEDVQDMQQKVTEIAGIQRDQPILIQLVELGAAAIGVAFFLHRIEITGVQPAIFPAVDQPGELPRWPALLIEIVLLDQLLQQA